MYFTKDRDYCEKTAVPYALLYLAPIFIDLGDVGLQPHEINGP